MAIEAVAFDKDGVIFDSERVYARGLDEAAAEFGITLPEGLHQRLCGLSEDKTTAVLRELLGDKADEFVREYWLPRVYYLLENENLPFIEGVESLIETLYAQGYPLALVTNDAHENVLRDMNNTRPELLKYFSVVITRDDVSQPKPAPEPYERAAALLGVNPEQLLVIEDSDVGASAAVAAGAKVLLLAMEREVSAQMASQVLRVIRHHHEALRELA